MENSRFLKDGISIQKNVMGKPMEVCSVQPMTGFYRDGYCHSSREDRGSHTVACQVTSDFLEFSKAVGNDLSTPLPIYGFPGLRPGDKWCLCAQRWQQAFQNYKAPMVLLAGTNEMALEHIKLDDLKSMALDLEVFGEKAK